MMVYYPKILFKYHTAGSRSVVSPKFLDDQLFDTFAASVQLLRQEPVQAKDRSLTERINFSSLALK